MLRNFSSGNFASHARFAARILVLAANTWPALVLLTPAFGQTALNLATQSKNADFSSFPFTRTVAVGTAVPSTCQIGQLFFESSAPAGQNLFGCAALNSWSLLGGYSYSFSPPLTQNGNTVSIPQATGSVDGFLSHLDWSTFNGKQPVGNYLTGLTGDLTASGPGAAAATLATVNGTPGTCGDSTHTCQITTNGKGLVTSQSAISIAGAGNNIAIQNSGTTVGSASTINFSSGLTATVNGSTATVISSGGGSGTTSNTTITNYLVTQSGATLIIQAGVSASVFPSASGTDVAYIYIDSNGNLDVGDSSVSLACTGCTALTGISDFPAGSKPIAVWNLSGSAFTTEAQDFSRVGFPATSTSTGIPGQWALGTVSGTSYIAYCTAVNAWVRVALSSTSW